MKKNIQQKTHLLSIISLLMFFIIFNCISDKEDDIPDKIFTGNNNYATLNGDTIGSGTTDNTLLRKEISISIINPDDKFSFGPSYATINSISNSGTYSVIQITNNSSQGFAFIKINTIIYKDSAGQTLSTNSSGFTYIKGSLGDVGHGIYTSTCLAPNEIGYIVLIDNNSVFDNLSAIEIGSIEYDPDVGDPVTKVIPQSYVCSDNEDIIVTVKNTGNSDVSPGIGSYYILMDSSDNPLNWGFLFFESSSLETDSDEILTATSWYSGASTRLYAIIDFEATDKKASNNKFK